MAKKQPFLGPYRRPTSVEIVTAIEMLAIELVFTCYDMSDNDWVDTTDRMAMLLNREGSEVWLDDRVREAIPRLMDAIRGHNG